MTTLRSAAGSILCSLIASLLCAPAGAAAVDCAAVSGRNIRWIVPYSPGGGYDIYSRLLEPAIEKALGAEVHIDNVTGAGGVVGARAIADADPDGLTLGLVHGAALLMGAFVPETRAPSPLHDFTLLGRVDRPLRAVYVSASGPFASIEELVAASEKKPLVAASTGTGGLSFIATAILTKLLQIDREFVLGYPGSREVAMAVLRGEADFFTGNYESVRDRVLSGELRTVLVFTGGKSGTYPELEGIPALDGAEGFGARRARALGVNVDEAVSEARSLAGLVSLGRLLVGPRGLPPETARCLAEGALAAMKDRAFEKAAAAAHRSLDVASAEQTRGALVTATERIDAFVSIIEEAVEKIRR